MKSIPLNELLRGLAVTDDASPVTLVTTDSRLVEPGCVFVAVKGETFDGHDFVPAALAAGAVCAIVEEYVDGADKEKQVVVPNTLNAHIFMAGNYRARFTPTLVGITGSVGKTTTKEFTYAVLSAFGKTLKNEGNKNNEIGLPQTLFKLDESYKYAITEMGMSGLGEIYRLTMAARPKIALITNIGVSHLEVLGSQENILRAKMEICEGLEEGSTLVLNADDEFLSKAIMPAGISKLFFGIDAPATVRASAIETVGTGTRFSIRDERFGNFIAHIPTIGRHAVYDALGAYTLGTCLGLPAREVADALANYQPAGQRQKVVDHGGVTCIEDCYNAAPASVRAALSTMQEMQASGRRIAILGDMLELGPDAVRLHEEAGAFAAENGVDILYTCGELAANTAAGARSAGLENVTHFDDRAALVESLKAQAKPGDILLFKASHSCRFEDLVEAYYNS